MATRAELLDAVGVRYRAAVRVERSRILDEFAAVTATTASMRSGCWQTGASGGRNWAQARRQHRQRLAGGPMASRSGMR